MSGMSDDSSGTSLTPAAPIKLTVVAPAVNTHQILAQVWMLVFGYIACIGLPATSCRLLISRIDCQGACGIERAAPGVCPGQLP